MPIMHNFMPINDDDACAKFTYFPKHIRHLLWWQHIHKQNYALKLRFQRQNNRSLWPILSNRFGFSHLARRENKKECNGGYLQEKWLRWTYIQSRAVSCAILQRIRPIYINSIWHMFRFRFSIFENWNCIRFHHLLRWIFLVVKLVWNVFPNKSTFFRWLRGFCIVMHSHITYDMCKYCQFYLKFMLKFSCCFLSPF